MQQCLQCRQPFEISADDLAFYQKASPVIDGKTYALPPPTHCPHCRQLRRLSFRNERVFYHRKCDLTGKQMISLYPQESPYTVYDIDAWWSDRWDGMQYGQEFDFSRPFFEQFKQLQQRVPRPNLFGKNNDNSLYTNHCDQVKNCYLCVDGGHCEDTYYSKYVIGAKDVCDCYMMNKSELCYDCMYTEGYNCTASRIIEQCSDCAFLYNSRGCHHCFMCWNLTNQSYCIENKQHTKEEYEKIMGKIDLGSHAIWQQCKKRFADLLFKIPHKYALLINCEDCSGDSLHNCKNVRDSFDVGNSRDCRYCYDADSVVDCYDTYESAFDCELQYESYACNRGKYLIGCTVSYDVNNLLYCDISHNSHDCFGCIGLRRKQYCILNKQYTKEEYEALVPKIIEHMKTPLRSSGSSAGQAGEWGEFFPMHLSPFSYNESIAQEFEPLTEQKALALGYSWHKETETQNQYLGPPAELPDSIMETPDSVCDKILLCEGSKKPYKIIPQELQLYRRLQVPIPRRSPDQRHRDRLSARNPRKLWNRNCDHCKKPIETTYAPERPEIVYCEECYLKTVY